VQEKLLVSVSPHLHDEVSIRRIMWSVVLALVPAACMSIYFFGWRAVLLYALSIGAAEAAELGCLAVRRKPLTHALDGSAFITGTLLAMVLPASAEWFCPVVGAFFAICIAKHCFGGLGANIWNPALAGRIFLQFAYPTQVSLSQWALPRMLYGSAPDAVTGPSPLFKGLSAVEQYQAWLIGKAAQATRFTHLDLFLGNGIPGSLGETCKLALLIGGIFLIARKYIDWRVPFFYISTVFFLSCILPARGEDAPCWINDPLYHILSGGLIIGAFFMATDMVTTPLTRQGRIIFAVGCGVLVALIRFYGGYPEGVAYSIVIMNTTTPLIDRWCRPRVFGSRTPRPAGGEK